MYRNMDYRYLSVIFRDIHFYSEVSLRDDIPLKLSITINKGNDKFEVSFLRVFAYNVKYVCMTYISNLLENTIYDINRQYENHKVKTIENYIIYHPYFLILTLT